MIKKNAGAPTAPIKDVDDYLAREPPAARATLEKLRRTIKAAAPMASEVISYQMPMYKHHGILVGFAAFKDHCSLFPGSAVMEAHKQDLKRYSEFVNRKIHDLLLVGQATATANTAMKHRNIG